MCVFLGDVTFLAVYRPARIYLMQFYNTVYTYIRVIIFSDIESAVKLIIKLFIKQES